MQNDKNFLEENKQYCINLYLKKEHTNFDIICSKLSYCFRAATAAKDAKDWSLPSFGSHLNLISTRGGQIMPTTVLQSSPC